MTSVDPRSFLLTSVDLLLVSVDSRSFLFTQNLFLLYIAAADRRHDLRSFDLSFPE